jgi:hypothetical protein
MADQGAGGMGTADADVDWSAGGTLGASTATPPDPASTGILQIWPTRVVLCALLTNVVVNNKLRKEGLQAVLITPAFGGAWRPVTLV